jgi:hypothetical protein
MKRKLKSKSSVYSFLKSKNVLETGSNEDIQKVRTEYWREYKRNWRKNKRKKEKEFSISLNTDELKLLSVKAKRHKVSRTKFIKQACFAYINKSFITPDTLEVRRISQLLSMTYNSIRELLEENKVSFRESRDSFEMIQRLERDLLPLLNNPNSLEESIKRHIVISNQNKSRLLEFINSL